MQNDGTVVANGWIFAIIFNLGGRQQIGNLKIIGGIPWALATARKPERVEWAGFGFPSAGAGPE